MPRQSWSAPPAIGSALISSMPMVGYGKSLPESYRHGGSATITRKGPFGICGGSRPICSTCFSPSSGQNSKDTRYLAAAIRLLDEMAMFLWTILGRLDNSLGPLNRRTANTEVARDSVAGIAACGAGFQRQVCSHTLPGTRISPLQRLDRAFSTRPSRLAANPSERSSRAPSHPRRKPIVPG